jgi:hypothetical protein
MSILKDTLIAAAIAVTLAGGVFVAVTYVSADAPAVETVETVSDMRKAELAADDVVFKNCVIELIDASYYPKTIKILGHVVTRDEVKILYSAENSLRQAQKAAFTCRY